MYFFIGPNWLWLWSIGWEKKWRIRNRKRPENTMMIKLKFSLRIMQMPFSLGMRAKANAKQRRKYHQHQNKKRNIFFLASLILMKHFLAFMKTSRTYFSVLVFLFLIKEVAFTDDASNDWSSENIFVWKNSFLEKSFCPKNFSHFKTKKLKKDKDFQVLN